MDLRATSSENLPFNRVFKDKYRLARKVEMWKPRNTENQKFGNSDHPEVGKSEINQKPKPTFKKRRDSCIRILGLLLDTETLETFNLTNKQAVTVY